MLIAGDKYTGIWDNNGEIYIIDQRVLPFEFSIIELNNITILIDSIKDMALRGAPLIGVAGAYGVYRILKDCENLAVYESYFEKIINELKSARPTAVNLVWAVDEVCEGIKNIQNLKDKINKALALAREIREFEIDRCKQIGIHGLEIIKNIYKKTKKPVNILTHCNAGWLATVDYGTATAPIYAARDAGIPVFVYVDVTGPRNQGSKLTSYELLNENIPHKIIADNAGGLLMMKKMVDLVIVGSDRTTMNGDVCNKIGTYLKALAAFDNDVPFYVALPSSTIDSSLNSGSEIVIEERDENEVLFADGLLNGKIESVRIAPIGSSACNFGFDITPAKYVTELITERGICKSTYSGITGLFPEFFKKMK